MLFEQILEQYTTMYEKSVDMYMNHIKTCEKCISSDKCEDEMKSIDLIESIQDPYYKYVAK